MLKVPEGMSKVCELSVKSADTVTAETAPLPSSNELADDRTQLALVRTFVALDRTLMAWIRTAASLISFGFTIYKFFDFLKDKSAPPPEHVIGPREFALLMIAIGVVSLIMAAIQHRQSLQTLRAVIEKRAHDVHQRPNAHGPRSLPAARARRRGRPAR